MTWGTLLLDSVQYEHMQMICPLCKIDCSSVLLKGKQPNYGNTIKK